MITMIPYVLAFIVPALAVIFVHVRQSVSRKLAELKQEALANVHKELLEQEILERQIENKQYRNRTLSDDTSWIATMLNGKTVHSSISISADGVRIEGDGINLAKFIPDFNPHEIITNRSGHHSVTNCPNCGAAFSKSMFCEFCGTKKP